MSTFFFNPGMTDIDTVIFGKDEIAVEIKCANCMDDFWAIVDADILNDSEKSYDFLHEVIKHKPRATVEHFNKYTEEEFRELWGGEDW